MGDYLNYCGNRTVLLFQPRESSLCLPEQHLFLDLPDDPGDQLAIPVLFILFSLRLLCPLLLHNVSCTKEFLPMCGRGNRPQLSPEGCLSSVFTSPSKQIPLLGVSKAQTYLCSLLGLPTVFHSKQNTSPCSWAALRAPWSAGVKMNTVENFRC